MNIVYDIGHAFFYIVFRLLFRCRAIGRQNVPKTGPCIIASNHASYLDPPIIGGMLWRRLNYVARDSLFNRPYKKFFLTRCKSIPIRREQLDKSVINSILGRIKAGEPVVLFPEGTRSPDGELLPGKPGVGLILSMAKVPVIPTYVKNSYLTLGKTHKRLRLVPLTVVFGEPMDLTGVKGKGHEKYQRMADLVMEEIAELKNALIN